MGERNAEVNQDDMLFEDKISVLDGSWITNKGSIE
jgi:hypothetical protein